MSYNVPKYSDQFSEATNTIEPRANPGKYVKWHERLPSTADVQNKLTYRGGVPRYSRLPQEDDGHWEETSFNNSDVAIDMPTDEGGPSKEERAPETEEDYGPSWDTEIDNELAPLVGAGASAVDGAALGVGGTELAAAGAVVGLGTLGVATAKAAINRFNEKGATLPGSEYIGPFNDIKIDAARNAGEQAAKTHDYNYQTLINYAKNYEIDENSFRERVHQFDQAAIDEFDADWKETGNWHSFVGKYGLKGKVAVEKLIGKNIYPKYTGNNTLDKSL